MELVPQSDEPSTPHPKRVLHDAIQAAMQHPVLVPGVGAYATVNQWVLVSSLILPGESSRKALIQLDGSTGGLSLTAWEREGLLFNALFGSSAMKR